MARTFPDWPAFYHEWKRRRHDHHRRQQPSPAAPYGDGPEQPPDHARHTHAAADARDPSVEDVAAATATGFAGNDDEDGWPAVADGGGRGRPRPDDGGGGGGGAAQASHAERPAAPGAAAARASGAHAGAAALARLLHIVEAGVEELYGTPGGGSRPAGADAA